MNQYFPPYRSFGTNINVKVDLSKYATEADLIEATEIDTSNFALKLVIKLNNIDTTSFILQTKYHTDKSSLEKEN